MEIAVCDDNELFLLEIEGQIQTLSIADNVSVFSCLEAFPLSIDGGKRYDAVLMDIEWNDKVEGMDAAKELYSSCPETKIIYVTGRVERYSQQIFLQNANLSGYLTKPVDTELLRANLQKVSDRIAAADGPALVLRRAGAAISISYRDIYYIESERHNIHVHTAGETLTVYERLENIMRSLPENFHQCHKSFVVNLRQIKRLTSNEVQLKNGETVPVSRSKYNETKEAYFSYMGHKL